MKRILQALTRAKLAVTHATEESQPQQTLEPPTPSKESPEFNSMPKDPSGSNSANTPDKSASSKSESQRTFKGENNSALDVMPTIKMMSADSKGDKKTILFVEDDQLVVALHRRFLENAGYCIETAENGLIALEKLPTVRPDLVVLDLMLPEIHGLEVLKFMRADTHLKKTPVIVLSNAYMGGLVSQAVKAGANQGVQKTECTPTKLVRMIRGLLGQQSSAGAASKDEKLSETDGLNKVSEHSEASAIDKARAELFADGPDEVALMRKDCVSYIKSVNTQESLECLHNLFRRVRFLGGRAWLSKCEDISELTSAFEAVLFDLVFKKANTSSSVFRTIAQAVDCLGRILAADGLPHTTPRAISKVLVVDDDAVFNSATSLLLKRACFEAVCEQDPIRSLELMRAQKFDLVLLDINMPGMTGFGVCEELRRIPGYEATPVIFVTLHNDLTNRAQSIVAGGNDLIGKPISSLELALKLKICLLDPSLRSASKEQSDGGQLTAPQSIAGEPSVASQLIPAPNLPAPSSKTPGDDFTPRVESMEIPAPSSGGIDSPTESTTDAAPTPTIDDLEQLRMENEAIKNKYVMEQQAHLQARDRIEELEQQVRQSVADAKKQVQDLKAQLNQTNRGVQEGKSSRHGLQLDSTQPGSELTEYRHKVEELTAKLEATSRTLGEESAKCQLLDSVLETALKKLTEFQVKLKKSTTVTL